MSNHYATRCSTPTCNKHLAPREGIPVGGGRYKCHACFDEHVKRLHEAQERKAPKRRNRRS